MVVGLVIGFIVIILFQLKILSKSNKKRKALIVSVILIGLGFTISLLLTIDKAPSSPTVLIEKIVKSII